MTLTRKGPTWHVMLKALENWATVDVLPHFGELVIVITGNEEGGSVLIEVGDEDKKPYSSVALDWTGKGAAVIRHALDTTESNLVAYRGKQERAAKKTAKEKKTTKRGKKK